MKEQTWQNPELDRSEWGSGPWDNEPDKVQWTDKDTGLPCIALRNRLGAWCGYVGVDRLHPYYLVNYDDVEVQAHGGLTFSDTCKEGPPEGAICHIPDPGEPDDVWWLGFDCAHFHDFVPGLTRMGELSKLSFPEVTYKALAYVQEQCTLLAAQLKERMNEVPDPGV